MRILLLLTGALALLALPGQHFTFAILGDRTGEAVPGVYEAAWKEIDARHPAFVINAGDTIQGGDDASARKEWELARRSWRKYPFFLVPGNHDIWSAASERIWREETRRAPHYGFDWEGAHVTVLDNSRGDQLADSELEFLRADLEANREKHPKLVFFHRPSWLLPVLLRNDEYPLHRLAKQFGVDAVVSGHVHEQIVKELDGVLYLDVGSSGGHIDRGTKIGQGYAEGWFFGYVEAEVSGGKVAFTAHELAPPFGQGRTQLLNQAQAIAQPREAR